QLPRRVDADHRVEFDVRRSDTGLHVDRGRLLTVVHRLDAGELECLLTAEPERLGVLTLRVLQRQYAHPDQVRAADALIGLGDHRPGTEKSSALGRPVTRRA